MLTNEITVIFYFCEINYSRNVLWKHRVESTVFGFYEYTFFYCNEYFFLLKTSFPFCFFFRLETLKNNFVFLRITITSADRIDRAWRSDRERNYSVRPYVRVSEVIKNPAQVYILRATVLGEVFGWQNTKKVFNFGGTNWRVTGCSAAEGTRRPFPQSFLPKIPYVFYFIQYPNECRTTLYRVCPCPFSPVFGQFIFSRPSIRFGNGLANGLIANSYRTRSSKLLRAFELYKFRCTPFAVVAFRREPYEPWTPPSKYFTRYFVKFFYWYNMYNFMI